MSLTNLKAILVSALLLPAVGWANYAEVGNGEEFIKVYQPLAEIDSDERLAYQMSSKGAALLTREINKLRQRGVITQEMFDDYDADNLIVNRNKLNKTLETLIKEVNKQYKERRDQAGGEMTFNDLRPQAYLIFLGMRKSGKLKNKFPKLKYLSMGSVNFALLLIPTIVKTISVKTGEVVKVEEESLIDFVFWPHLDSFDMEVTTTQRRTTRIGAGAIWGLKDKMLKPGDFRGVATGFSINSPAMTSYISRIIPGVSELVSRIPKIGPLINQPNNYKLGALYDYESITDKGDKKLNDMIPDYVYFIASKSFTPSGKPVTQFGFKLNPLSGVMAVDDIIGYGFDAMNSFFKQNEKSLSSDIKTITGVQTPNKTLVKKGTSKIPTVEKK